MPQRRVAHAAAASKLTDLFDRNSRQVMLGYPFAPDLRASF